MDPETRPELRSELFHLKSVRFFEWSIFILYEIPHHRKSKR